MTIENNIKDFKQVDPFPGICELPCLEVFSVLFHGRPAKRSDGLFLDERFLVLPLDLSRALVLSLDVRFSGERSAS